MRLKNATLTRPEFSPAKQLLLQKRLQGQANNAVVRPQISRAARNGTAPLSFAQQRLWFLDQLAPGSPVYNISEGLRLKGALEVTALEQSLKEIVRRHEAVRTTFRAVDGQPVQIISSVAEFSLVKRDLARLPAEQWDLEVNRLAEEEARKPFDLTSDLMLRAVLLRLSPEEHVLLLTMHHIASDAWSMNVLYR